MAHVRRASTRKCAFADCNTPPFKNNYCATHYAQNASQTVTIDYNSWRKHYPTSENQADFFLLKFSTDKDITREKVMSLMQQFCKFDGNADGELEEDEAMRLLESRGETKTFTELRQSVADIDLDHNRKLSFLEWGCAYFHKSWTTLHSPFVDAESIARADALIKQIEAKAAAKRESERQAEEEEKRRRQAEINRGGVAGKAALFKYAASDTADQTLTNEQKIRADADARREKRLAEQQRREAESGKELERRAQAEYASQKSRAEQEAQAKAEAEARAREESRKKLAARAALFGVK